MRQASPAAGSTLAVPITSRRRHILNRNRSRRNVASRRERRVEQIRSSSHGRAAAEGTPVHDRACADRDIVANAQAGTTQDHRTRIGLEVLADGERRRTRLRRAQGSTDRDSETGLGDRADVDLLRGDGWLALVGADGVAPTQSVSDLAGLLGLEHVPTGRPGAEAAQESLDLIVAVREERRSAARRQERLDSQAAPESRTAWPRSPNPVAARPLRLRPGCR